MSNYSKVLEELNSLEFSGMKLGIERIQKALKGMGNPEKKLKIIHLAGTNGKGSTAAMISKALSEAGKKTGMFTSPHLIDVRERIQIDGKNISKEDFEKVFNQAKKEMEKGKTELTFFETITIMAVIHFLEQKADYAIFEAGLGGKYDATNFKTSMISVLTRIGIDHTHILGDTIEKIAEDKCGIIKQGQEVVTTESNEKVMQIIEQKTRKKGSKLYKTGNYHGEISLEGDFQKENAGIAEKVCRLLGVEEETIKKAFKEVEWPGRIEWKHGFEGTAKRILLDCAHNPSGMEALAKYIQKQEYERLILVFAVSRNKDYKRMLEKIRYDKLIFTQTSTERKMPLEKVKAEGKSFEKTDNPVEALNRAKEIAREKDLIVATGSIFLVGELKKGFEEKNTETENI